MRRHTFVIESRNTFCIYTPRRASEWTVGSDGGRTVVPLAYNWVGANGRAAKWVIGGGVNTSMVECNKCTRQLLFDIVPRAAYAFPQECAVLAVVDLRYTLDAMRWLNMHKHGDERRTIFRHRLVHATFRNSNLIAFQCEKIPAGQ